MHLAHDHDTIAALATAPGAAGVSVIRISGPDSLVLADRVFACAGPKPSQRPSHTLVVGRVMGGPEAIDEAVLLIMRAPRSYTREDVVEIQCHGGLATSRRVLRCVLEAGARPAEPGEFTCRAFLHGRLDLVQAEAVNDLVRARSARAARSAWEQLEGRLSRRFNELYDALIGLAADMAAALDFPDDELAPPVIADVLRRSEDSVNALRTLIATWNEGHCLRDGLQVVIAGRTNVGKSTLMNALLGRNRSIVSETPGTTRDTIEESFVLNGIQLILVDTAGLRDPQCAIEQEGIRRTHRQMEKADIYLYVVDASQALPPDDIININGLSDDTCIVVGNKTDLGKKCENVIEIKKRYCDTSLIYNTGIEELINAINEIIDHKFMTGNSGGVAISERHRKVLENTLTAMEQANFLLRQGLEESYVLVAGYLRDAAEQIGLVTGKEYNESLLESIFSNFCIGK